MPRLLSSSVPRPQRKPSRTSPPNGATLQPGPAGTTSMWCSSRTARPPLAGEARRAQRLARPSGVLTTWEAMPSLRNRPARKSAARCSLPGGFEVSMRTYCWSQPAASDSAGGAAGASRSGSTSQSRERTMTGRWRRIREPYRPKGGPPEGAPLKTSQRLQKRLVGLLRPADEESVGPDDVLVVVGGVEAGNGVVVGDGASIAAIGTNRQHGLRQHVGGVHVVRIGILPAVLLRHRLQVLRHEEAGDASSRQSSAVVGRAEGDLGGRRAGVSRANLVGQPREHGGAAVVHVGHGPLLFRLLERVQEVRDEQGRDDADDRYDDQQLDQCEALLTITDLHQHGRVSSPRFYFSPPGNPRSLVTR